MAARGSTIEWGAASLWAASRSLRQASILYAAILISSALLGGYVEYRGVYPQPGTFRNLADSVPCGANSPVSDCTLLLADSDRYISDSYTFSLADQFDAIRNGNLISIGALDNVILYLDFDLARRLAPGFPYALIIFLNATLYIASLANARAIARCVGVDQDATMWLCVANLETLYSISSLNKEIIGIFLVSAIARAFVRRSTMGLVFCVGAALFTRAAFGIFGLFVLVRYFLPRLRFWLMALGLCLAITVVINLTGGKFSAATTILAVSENENQKSQAIMNFAGQAMLYPLGPIITWIIVDGISVASPALLPSNYPMYFSFNGFSMELFVQQLSSFLCIILGADLTYRWIRLRFRMTAISEMVMLYFIVFGSYPISQHRYLLSIWFLLVIAFLGYRRGTVPFPTALRPVAGAQAAGGKFAA